MPNNNATKRIAVILAGCGRFDGSEIHESVLTLLSIMQNNATYQCFSLDLPQDHITNHLTEQNSTNETRNMLVESARIARGAIKKLEELDPHKFEALIIPGGNGVAYNLFNLALEGENYSVHPLIKQVCQLFTKLRKPIGAICITPAMLPKIYGAGIELTIGNDTDTNNILTSLGAKCINCEVDEIHIDTNNLLVTTPAYMLATNIVQAYTGIKKLVEAVIKLT